MSALIVLFHANQFNITAADALAPDTAKLSVAMTQTVRNQRNGKQWVNTNILNVLYVAHTWPYMPQA